AEPGWKGMFFLQDATGGVFVNNKGHPGPVPGDVVEVTGVSDRGGYSRGVTSPQWKKMGNAPLPEARPVSIERIMSGADDGQRVEVRGVVTSAHPSEEESRLAVEITSGGRGFWAFVPLSAVRELDGILGAKVRARGTPAISLETQHGGKLNVVMYLP